MYENPLMPNAKLKELYALMQRCRSLARKSRDRGPSLEALLAASMMHLQDDDFLSPLSGSALAQKLADERGKTALPAHRRLAIAGGVALALKLAKEQKLVLAFTHAGSITAGSEEGWADVITYATKAELPLLIVCADTGDRNRTTNPKAINWPSMSKLAKSLRLPVFSVDGADAVAVYRVMQESALRARTVGGVAVIWCAFPPSRLASATDPLQHMKTYLAARNLLPASTARKRRIR